MRYLEWHGSRRWLALGICALLGGCAVDRGEMSLALEDLGSDVSQTRGAGGESYRSSVNVAGLTPYHPLGLAVSVPGRKVPDMFSMAVSPECSKVLIQDFPTTLGDDQLREAVVTVRDQAERLRAALAAVLAARIQLELFKLQTAQLAQTPTTQQEALRARLASVFGIKQDATAAELSVAQKKLEDGLQAASAVAEKEKKEVAKALSVPSVLVTRWNVERFDGIGGKLGEFFGVSRSHAVKRSGIVVVGGLRSTSLWLGDDVLVGYRGRGYDSGIDAAMQSRYVVTHGLSARHVTHIEERSAETLVGARLGMTVSQIAQLFGGALPAGLQDAMVNLDATWQRLLQVGEQGLLSTPRRSLFQYRFASDRAREQSALAHADRMHGYVTFYSVRTDLAHVAAQRPGGSGGESCSQTEPASVEPDKGRWLCKRAGIRDPQGAERQDSSACVALTRNLLSDLPQPQGRR